MMQGCRLARLFGKSIMDFYARNQYFLMNTQPSAYGFLLWLRIKSNLMFDYPQIKLNGVGRWLAAAVKSQQINGYTQL